MSGQQINCIECAPRWKDNIGLPEFDFQHDGTEKILSNTFEDTGRETVHLIPGNALKSFVCDFCNKALLAGTAVYAVEIYSDTIQAHPGWHLVFIDPRTGAKDEEPQTASKAIPVPGKSYKFKLGKLVATPGALRAMASTGVHLVPLLERHRNGDWGDVCVEDQAANDMALNSRLRILSAYPLGETQKLWIITEGDRSVTTLLLPEEY